METMQDTTGGRVDGFYCDVEGVIFAADAEGREWRLDTEQDGELARRAAEIQERADQAAEIALAVQRECRAALLELAREHGCMILPHAGKLH